MLRNLSASTFNNSNISSCNTSIDTVYLFVIKGRRPLTHHIGSITITTKKCTGSKDEQVYNASYKTTQTSISCK